MKLALVRLREAGQTVTYKVDDEVELHDSVIIEADRGFDYGEVIEISAINPPVLNEKPASFKTVTRKVNTEDAKQIKENKQEARDAMKLCSRKMREHKLNMKLVDGEYSFDKKKIVFYFTAEDRIDFRELVKDLAKMFKVRIEMRQIGVRDEARLFGGVGPCGECLCCVRFLRNFEVVSMKMAKTQRLPLSAGKNSGICGRLMCCLGYEYKTYKDLTRGLPKEGQIIDTPQGKGKVTAVSVLKRAVQVQMEDGRFEKITYPDNQSYQCDKHCQKHYEKEQKKDESEDANAIKNSLK